MKLIGRVSAKGNTYYQTAKRVTKEDGTEETVWYPVFLKKSLDGKFDTISREKKVDSRGIVYELIEIADSHVFEAVEDAEDGTKKTKYIITK